MAQSRKGGRQAHKGQSGAPAAQPATNQTSLGLIAFGSLGLLLAIVGSGILAWGHIAQINPPGCGPGSGCDEATRSVWGSIPGLGWPTSHVGLAFFIAMTAAWITSIRHGFSGLFMWLLRLGALISVLLAVVMFANGYLCRYCLMAHGGNLLFWLCAEIAARRSAGETTMPVKTAVGVFVFATLLLIPVEVIAQGRAADEAEQQAAEDIDRILDAPDEDREVFTGRYLFGPEKAAIRVVALTDYQCPDCQRFEKELRDIMENRDDISLSVKQFPMSNKCNQYMQRDMHANACMAARAAETAGIIGGNDAFWKMHFWLFDQGGEFTDATFAYDLRKMGYDPDEFIEIMLSDQTLKLVQQDIDEGVKLGLFFTPMVFINGVELRNPHFAGTVTRAIEELSKKNLEPKSADEAGDVPPTAKEKFVNDWEISREFVVPDDTHSFPLGDDDPIVDVVVWGDYEEPNTMTVDRLIRQRMAVQDGFRYQFRHFPMDQTCNTEATRTVHQNACLAAKAVEAAGILGGADAWWDMHASLIMNYNMIDEQLINEAAANLDVDQDRLLMMINSANAQEAIVEDALAGKQMALDRVPYVFINGKRLRRITMQGQLAVGYIFDDLLGELTPEQRSQMRRVDLGGIGSRANQIRPRINPN